MVVRFATVHTDWSSCVETTEVVSHSLTLDSRKFRLGCRGFDSRGSGFRRCWSSGSIQISHDAGSGAAGTMLQRSGSLRRGCRGLAAASKAQRAQPAHHSERGGNAAARRRWKRLGGDEFYSPSNSFGRAVFLRFRISAPTANSKINMLEREHGALSRKDNKSF